MKRSQLWLLAPCLALAILACGTRENRETAAQSDGGATAPKPKGLEAAYLRALQGTERFEQDGSTLTIYSKGMEKPLRFTRKQP